MWEKIQPIVELFKQTALGWSRNRASRMAAALSYFTVLSLSPLLVFAVGIAGIFYGPAVAASGLMQQIELVAGTEIKTAVESVITDVSRPQSGILASSLSLLVLLYGASNIFNQLQDALNTIWHVAPEGRAGFWLYLQRRSLAFVWVLGVGLIVITLLTASTAIATVNNFLQDQAPPIFFVILPIIDFAISIILLSIVFAGLFKGLPNTLIPLTDVIWGGVLTAVLFTISKYALSLYLSRGSVGSAYGAAGSLVVILVWVYFSGQIFFFGAQFTKAYADLFGSRKPQERAE